MARAACAGTGSESALTPHRDFAAPVDGYQADGVRLEQCAQLRRQGYRFLESLLLLVAGHRSAREDHDTGIHRRIEG
jgi:hypothetical protein